jgi:hypothetical protein
MNKQTMIMLSVASAIGLSPFVGPTFAGDDLKTQKTIKPATLTYASTPNRTDAAAMIGHKVEDISGNNVGEVEGIHIGKDGTVADVVVGVGGFLGVGQRDVMVKWSALRIIKDADAVDKIVLAATKDELKTMTAYKFERSDQRRTIFDAPM